MVDKVDQVVVKVEESKEKCYEGSSYLVVSLFNMEKFLEDLSSPQATGGCDL